MQGLQIQPHSRHVSGLAVAFLALLAAGSFVAGVNHQLIAAHSLSPFPAPSPPAVAQAAAIPEATPARDMQLTDAAPSPPRHAAKDPLAIDEPKTDAAATPAPAAEAPPAVDASATASTDSAPADPKAAQGPEPTII